MHDTVGAKNKTITAPSVENNFTESQRSSIQMATISCNRTEIRNASIRVSNAAIP
jgi:hypothetical protein